MVFRAAARRVAGLVVCTALLSSASAAMDLGVRVTWDPAATGQDLRLPALAEAGIGLAVLTPSGPDGPADVHALLADPAGIAALRTVLEQADTAKLRVYLAGLELARADHPYPPEEQARVVEDAVQVALAQLGDCPALAGFVWRASPPPVLPESTSPPQVEPAARRWAEGTADLARSCSAMCAGGRRVFVVETDAALPLAAALPQPTEGLAVWRSQSVPSGPSLLPQRAVLEAAAWAEAGGVELAWPTFRPGLCSRWATLAATAGCGTAILGSAEQILQPATGFRTGWVRELREFSQPVATTTPAAPDVVLVVDPFAELCRTMLPGDDREDQVLPALAALNQATRSVRIATTVPAGPPTLAPPAKEGEAPRVPVIVAANSARMEDPYLAGLLAAADRGWTVALLADAATMSLGGGARAKESRDLATAALPFERTRVFADHVRTLVLRENLGPKPLRKNGKLTVGSPPSQCIWRGTPRAGARVLAEWVEPSTAAYVADRRGAGTLLVVNGMPGLVAPSVLGGVLDALNAPSSRLVLAESVRGGGDRPTEPRQGTLDRHGLIPQDPYRAEAEDQLFAPLELGAGLPVAQEMGSYDVYVAGPDGALGVLLGYRPLGTETLRYQFGPQTTSLGPWDAIASRGLSVACTVPGVRFPEAAGAARFEPTSGEVHPLLYAPAPGLREAPEAGVFRLGGPAADHSLVDLGGSRPVRAERVPEASGAIVVEVDRPALLEFALDEARMAGRALRVSLGTPQAPSRELSPQWWVTWDGKLFVDVLGRVPVTIADDTLVTEDPARCATVLAPGRDAAGADCDGAPAVLLDCYANAEAVLTFEHWSPPGAQNTLALSGVRGSLYGKGQPGEDAPARLIVLVNGRSVYDAAVPWRSLEANGTRDEWADLQIIVPAEALHRGANVVTVRNAGPNAVWIGGGEMRFASP